MMGGKALVKRLLGRVVAEYRLNWIYAADTPPATGDDPGAEAETPAYRAMLRASPTDKMRTSQSYAEAGFEGLVLAEGGRPLSVAHFAGPDRYDRHATWPLRPGDIALMDIATEEAARGRGLAVRLIRAATGRYLARGHKRLIAFVWWTNTPSLRAMDKAGWKRIGFSAEVRFATRWYAVRLPLFRR